MQPHRVETANQLPPSIICRGPAQIDMNCEFSESTHNGSGSHQTAISVKLHGQWLLEVRQPHLLKSVNQMVAFGLFAAACLLVVCASHAPVIYHHTFQILTFEVPSLPKRLRCSNKNQQSLRRLSELEVVSSQSSFEREVNCLCPSKQRLIWPSGILDSVIVRGYKMVQVFKRRKLGM